MSQMLDVQTEAYPLLSERRACCDRQCPADQNHVTVG